MREEPTIRELITETANMVFRDGYDDGLRDGRQWEARAILLHLLYRRFGELSIDDLLWAERANSDEINKWMERILNVDTLDELFGDRCLHREI